MASFCHIPCFVGLVKQSLLGSYSLLYFPLVETDSVLVGLVNLQLEGVGRDGIELYGVRLALHAGVRTDGLHGCPSSLFVAVRETPCFGYTASAPRTVVEPIDGAG